MSVVKGKGYLLHAGCRSYAECFPFNANGIPLPFKQVLHRAIWIDLLDVDVGNVRAIPGGRPRDSVVETIQEKRAAKPTDSADVEFAGNDQVSFIVLKAIVPRHVSALHVDNAAIRRPEGRNRPLVGAELWKLVRFSLDFLKRIVSAVEAQIIATFQRFNIFRRDGINPSRNLRAVLGDVLIYTAGEGG